MKLLYILTLFALVLFSCRHKNSSVALKRTNKKDSSIYLHPQPKYIPMVKEDTTPIVVDTTKKLLAYQLIHPFSDTAKKDNFSITLFGKSVNDGTLVFKITDYKQKQIFKEIFSASDLLGDLANDLNSNQKEDTIRARMARFLAETNFAMPAIDSKEAFDDAFENPDKLDKENWLAVKADPTAVAFIYNYGYEGTYGIAFSKRQKKVVSIFYSD